jgi:hypothetical protein
LISPPASADHSAFGYQAADTALKTKINSAREDMELIDPTMKYDTKATSENTEIIAPTDKKVSKGKPPATVTFT